jgi:signal transduction histidine kinase
MIPAKILVVEDERVVAMHLRQQLSLMGYAVPAMATRGAQALQHVMEWRPDLVLMDIHIEGDMDGIETASRIPPELQIPVIYLTAYSEEQTLERARATKPYGYLLKPFSERELHATIQMVLERRRADITARQTAECLEQLVVARTAELIAANLELERQTAERRKVERTLHQAQKMEAVGQLTGGIAHDFNNALTVISGNIEAIEQSGEIKTPQLQRALAAAARCAARAATLIRRLLAFSRLQPLDPRSVDLNALVSGMQDMLERTLGSMVSIDIVLAKGLWPVSADENQLESVLLNLALNARDAMPEGGHLTIETGNVLLDEAYVATQTEVAPGQYVTVAVSDTGTGMSQAIRDKAFEPFFTTKEFGQGTGLGLSQVYGFIKQSGGHTEIDTTPGEGTTVWLYLPRDHSAPERAPDRESGANGIELGTILVVEDDDDGRSYSVGMLRELGYRVLEAHDGPTALLVLGAEPVTDLVFTDVGLPGELNGRRFAHEVLRRHPGLRILFTAGSTRDAVVHQGRLDPGVELLAKPFTYADLAAKVRAMLDSRTPQ